MLGHFLPVELNLSS